MNADLEKAIAFLTPQFTRESYYTENSTVKEVTNERALAYQAQSCRDDSC